MMSDVKQKERKLTIARAMASDTDSIAFIPRFCLRCITRSSSSGPAPSGSLARRRAVSSSSDSRTRSQSIRLRSARSAPSKRGATSWRTLSTALRHPLPP